jgi:hypothetical protein
MTHQPNALAADADQNQELTALRDRVRHDASRSERITDAAREFVRAEDAFLKAEAEFLQARVRLDALVRERQDT